MSKTLIFERQTVPFGLHPDYGIYFAEIAPPVFAFVEGATYTVLWDGVEYVGQAGPLEFMGMTWQVVGNRALLGGDATGEPFGIGSVVTADGAPYSNVVATVDTAESHTVAIWQGADPGIVLKNRTGDPVTYVGAYGGIRVPLADGSKRLYIDAESVPVPVEKTVELDFSGGDMVITPDVGAVFSKLLIPRPANHISENIRDGIVLSGILGAMKAGSGGGGDLVGEGKFISVNNNGDKPTISHNLGVIPDLVIAYTLNLTANYPFVILASNRISFPTQNTSPANTAIVYTGTGVSTVGESGGNGIESADSTCLVYGATDRTISIGGTGLGKGFWILYFIGRATKTTKGGQQYAQI